MSRKERHGRASGKRKGQSPDYDASQVPGERTDWTQLPPRRKKYPSSLHNLNKWYYNLLFILFLGLVAFLFWYGNKFSS